MLEVVGAGKKRKSLERKYQRATCRFNAEYTWGTLTHPATILVIGIGGCFLCSEALVPVGEEIELSLSLSPEERPILCLAKVAWVADRGVRIRGRDRPRGFAVEFMRIFPEHRSRIDDYVRIQSRLFKFMIHELDKQHPDNGLVKEIFRRARPGESTHLNHIRKVCREEQRFFRLRK